MSPGFRIVVFVACCCTPGCRGGNERAVQPGASDASQLNKEWADLLARMGSGRNQDILNAAGWTFLHAVSEETVARLKEPIDLVVRACGGEADAIVKIGGVDGFRKTLRNWLGDPDPVVQGWAAVNLACTGDRESIGEIARLLKPRPGSSLSDPDDPVDQYERYSAAVALGILHSEDHVSELCILLKDASYWLRAGAALGLGYMGARDKAGDVARLLEDHKDQACLSAIEALAEMDAREWAPKIAGLLQSTTTDVAKKACYALVRLRANAQAADVAALLHEEYKKGTAAKSLALLGETRYAGDIARLLESGNSLDRMDACLALGILDSKAHEKDLAEIMKDPKEEDFVRNAAAVALLLLDSRQHATEILGTLRAVLPTGQYATEEVESLVKTPIHELSPGNFHPIVFKDLEALAERAEENLQRMREYRARQTESPKE